MDQQRLPPDFREFLRLLTEHEVEFLLVGGHAVGVHGHPRNTLDLDVWIRLSPDNADRIVRALIAFGFDVPGLNRGLFLQPDKIMRMGVPPLRIEIHTGLSGVDFQPCAARSLVAEVDGVRVPVIALDDLRANKRAAGRAKDLADLEALDG